MKAAQIKAFGSASEIHIVDVEKPTPRGGQVLIEVHASSINPVDKTVREGFMQPMVPLNLPIILGFDAAGVVKEIGDGVTGFSKGDKVYGEASVLGGGTGAFAEFACAPSTMLAKMPSNLSFLEAASIGLTGTSAVQALYEHIKLQPHQKILIHGGSGGIGSIAIQIAKYVGAYVATTATGDSMQFCSQLGADDVIDYKMHAFQERLSDFDAVLDTVGGETYADSFKILKKGGVILSMLEQPDKKLMEQFGVTAIYQGTKVNTEHLNRLRELVEEGVVAAHVDKAFTLDQIQEAFDSKEHEHIHGKIGIEIKK